MNEVRLNIPELTVSELSTALKRTVEEAYGYVRVRGELGNVKYHSSGHVYLDLKDDKACLAGIIWRTSATRIKVKLEAGLEVVVTGRITTYPGQSKYQIVIETLEPAGVGALMALLAERKRKLTAEGLFDEARKQLLPYLPTVIGVITSPTGAVIRDILHRLADRFPRRVLVWPVRVQGETSAAEVAAAIRGFNALGAGQPDRAAGRDHRRARRRIARRPVVVQRGDRRAGGGREHDPAHLRRRTRDRCDADRFCRRPPGADADGGGGDRGAGARRAARGGRRPGAAAHRVVAARDGRPPDRAALGGTRAANCRPSARRAAPARRQRRGAVAARAERQRADPPYEVFAHRRAALAGAVARAAGALRGAGACVDHARGARARGAGARRRERLTSVARRLATAGTAYKAAQTARLDREKQIVAALFTRASRAMRVEIMRGRAGLGRAEQLLTALSYRRVLERGFALVRDAAGEPLRAAASVPPGARLALEFADGRVGATADGVATTAAVVRPAPRPPAKPRPRRGGEGQGACSGLNDRIPPWSRASASATRDP